MAGWTCRARRDYQQQWRRGRDLDSGEVAELLELAASVVPLHPPPVIETLQGQVDVLVALSSITASRRSRVTVSTSIIGRSEAENAGTCEYTRAGVSRESRALTSRATSDSSQRSGCIRHNGLVCGASARRDCQTARMNSANSAAFSSVSVVS